MRCWVAIILLLLAACSGGGREGGGYGARSDFGKEKVEVVTLVLVDDVSLGEVADNLSSSAIIESESAADIIPSTSGVVLSLHKDEGDSVRKGDLLAVLENVSLDAGAERSRAELTRVQQQYDEMAQLASRGAVSDRELEDLAYQLQTAKTSAREASRSFGQTRLTAPFDGVVAARDVRVGELASGSTVAFRVVDLEHLRAVTTLPERDLKRVALGQGARLTSAYDDESSATGSVVRLAPVIDATSGTFRVTIQLDHQETLRPGQFVTVDLEVDRRRDVVVVPKGALVYEDGIPVVYRFIPEPEKGGEQAEEDEEASEEEPWYAGLAAMFGGEDADSEEEGAEEETTEPFVAERVSVKLGLVDDDFAEVIEGVSEGDRVIVVGQSHLRDGARVRVNDSERDNAGAEPEDDSSEDKG